MIKISVIFYFCVNKFIFVYFYRLIIKNGIFYYAEEPIDPIPVSGILELLIVSREISNLISHPSIYTFQILQSSFYRFITFIKRSRNFGFAGQCFKNSFLQAAFLEK